MKLPRLAAWPALLALGAAPAASPPRGCAGVEDPVRRHPRVVVLGIDGMDPDLLAEAIARFPERMRNFARLVEQNGLHRLGTSTPPQSPVAWSNFITGLDPGGHGIFDFIHRDRVTRRPAPSTTRDDGASRLGPVGGWHVPLGGGPSSNRSGRAFWSLLADRGVPADVWRMPANFPAEPSEGVSLAGMMTPALDSAYGESKLYTSDLLARAAGEGGKAIPVRVHGDRIDTYLRGPENPFREDGERILAPLVVLLDREANAAAIDTGGRVLVLRPGEWSDFVRFRFQALPLGLAPIPGIARFHLRRIEPDFEMLVSAVNIDPLDPVAPIAAPASAARETAREIGLYYTQGMPEDVNALKDRLISDGEFLSQSQLVHEEGARMLEHALSRWLAREEGGFLFFYFSGVDLCSHMLWRHADEQHPHHDARFAAGDTSDWSGRPGSTWKDVVLDLYLRMDPVLGRVRERIGEDALLVVMSDHGFAPYRRKFSLNTWLLEKGYLVLEPGQAKELPRTDPAFRGVGIEVQAPDGGPVDWTRTRAYGVGFNGLYLNLAGREQDDPRTAADESGIVEPGAEAEALLAEIRAGLEALVDPETGERVVLRADPAREVYRGARIEEAPDLVVGYASGYGNSDPASLGRIPNAVLEDNLGGTFNGSHLMAPEVVPGVLLSTAPVRPGAHGLEDLTVEVLRRYGVSPAEGMRGSPVLALD